LCHGIRDNILADYLNKCGAKIKGAGTPVFLAPELKKLKVVQ
jgi:UDP-N-acetylglucosamine enolpyruvyl transferase